MHQPCPECSKLKSESSNAPFIQMPVCSSMQQPLYNGPFNPSPFNHQQLFRPPVMIPGPPPSPFNRLPIRPPVMIPGPSAPFNRSFFRSPVMIPGPPPPTSFNRFPIRPPVMIPGPPPSFNRQLFQNPIMNPGPQSSFIRPLKIRKPKIVLKPDSTSRNTVEKFKGTIKELPEISIEIPDSNDEEKNESNDNVIFKKPNCPIQKKSNNNGKQLIKFKRISSVQFVAKLKLDKINPDDLRSPFTSVLGFVHFKNDIYFVIGWRKIPSFTKVGILRQQVETIFNTSIVKIYAGKIDFDNFDDPLSLINNCHHRRISLMFVLNPIFVRKHIRINFDERPGFQRHLGPFFDESNSIFEPSFTLTSTSLQRDGGTTKPVVIKLENTLDDNDSMAIKLENTMDDNDGKDNDSTIIIEPMADLNNENIQIKTEQNDDDD